VWWHVLLAFVLHRRGCVGCTKNDVKSGFVCGVVETSESAC
jgi:hypothetical protein